jgi:hypothetical protein
MTDTTVITPDDDDLDPLDLDRLIASVDYLGLLVRYRVERDTVGDRPSRLANP